ncbi:MAG: glycosyltransferase [Actinomycetota bacterium]|nr:glycosyltransferase [Actinomycetota bacterium]
MGSFRTGGRIDFGESRKVLFLSRLERRKGPAVLIEVMARLRDLDATLIVAGEGPEVQACTVAAQRGITARFIGSVAEEELPGCLSFCRRFLRAGRCG